MDLSNSGPKGFQANEPVQDVAMSEAEEVFWLLMKDLLDGVDHPEIWEAFPTFLARFPDLAAVMREQAGLIQAPRMDARIAYTILLAMGSAVQGDPAGALAFLGELATRFSESPLVQGAVFHINSLMDPTNPKYD